MCIVLCWAFYVVLDMFVCVCGVCFMFFVCDRCLVFWCWLVCGFMCCWLGLLIWWWFCLVVSCVCVVWFVCVCYCFWFWELYWCRMNNCFFVCFLVLGCLWCGFVGGCYIRCIWMVIVLLVWFWMGSCLSYWLVYWWWLCCWVGCGVGWLLWLWICSVFCWWWLFMWCGWLLCIVIGLGMCVFFVVCNDLLLILVVLWFCCWGNIWLINVGV